MEADREVIMMRKRLVVAARWKGTPSQTCRGVYSVPPPWPSMEKTMAMPNMEAASTGHMGRLLQRVSN